MQIFLLPERLTWREDEKVYRKRRSIEKKKKKFDCFAYLRMFCGIFHEESQNYSDVLPKLVAS